MRPIDKHLRHIDILLQPLALYLHHLDMLLRPIDLQLRPIDLRLRPYKIVQTDQLSAYRHFLYVIIFIF
jgi:hypothetical protein